MKKKKFLKAIKTICGVTKLEEIEKHISKTFYNNEDNKFFESLERIKKEVNSDKIDQYKDIKYKNIFDTNITNFLQRDEVKDNIAEYINKYNDLLDKSTYFKKGIFNHSQAEDTAKQLKNNGFFRADHSVLFGGKEIKNETELTNIIQEEKDKILTDQSLKEAFNKLDTQLRKNQGLKDLRELLSNHQFIIAELANPPSFDAKLWKYYLSENKEKFNELLMSIQR